METWKAVKNYKGYFISDQGNLKNIGRYGKDGRYLKPKTITPSKDKDGYLIVHISNLQGSKKLKLHRLVCAAFHGESDLVVDHIDGDKANNVATNLQWLTAQENTHKSCAKKGKVVDPEGKVHYVNGIAKFCRENNLDRSGLTYVLSGKQRHTKGWTRYEGT